MKRRDFAVLMALLIVTMLIVIPLTMRTRAHRERITCSLNMGQLGIALSTYQAEHDSFPSGTIPSAELPADRRLSWLVRLLPYVEGKSPYWQVDRTKGWDSD